MDRRTFLHSAAASAVTVSMTADEVLATTSRPAPVPNPRALIMDAMGELRPIYEPSLVREMLGSGTDAITVTLCDPKPVGAEGLQAAIDGLMEYDRYLAANPALFIKATSVAHVDEARRSGRMAVFYLYQNSIQFGEDLDRVEMFRSLGLTSCQITYNERNFAGVGCRAEGDNGGLTPFGRELIDRLNSAGILVDLAHANARTMADTIAHSRMPVINSHTGCDAVHPHARNMSDANMRATAERGGVVGICQLRPFLTLKKSDNLHAYFDHIEHAVNVCGIEHVCIGSDRDHRVIEMTPEYEAELRAEEGSQVSSSELPYFIDELNGPRRMEVVWDGVAARGYSEGDVEKIMGRNQYRLYREVIG
ncbi:MAG: membrane dipeptidase [Gemmatimonadetes bacterium]|nr:membrane dipeptidase [Gemmatimonadota bacterium]MDA1102961.1 membrane dipeptidase [Gemmatimonadota bacterium]